MSSETKDGVKVPNNSNKINDSLMSLDGLALIQILRDGTEEDMTRQNRHCYHAESNLEPQ